MADNNRPLDERAATRNPLRVLTTRDQDEFLNGLVDCWSGAGYDLDGHLFYAYGYELACQPAPREASR
jgi:hypothetical protein